MLKVSAETFVNVVNLSELLSRFVLPGVPANTSAHSVLLQVIHAVDVREPVPMSGNMLPSSCWFISHSALVNFM